MKAGIYASPTMPLDIVDLPEPPNSVGGGCNALGMLTGIYAVYPNDDLNWVSLSVETENPAGNYIVYWGDGTTSSHLSGTVATHQFLYANCVNPSRNGYRQAWVQIEPEITCPIDNNLIGVNLQYANPTGYPTSTGHWLRLAIKAPAIQYATIGGDVVNLGYLYSFVFYRDTRLDGTSSPYPMNAITNFNQMFKGCYALITIKGQSTYEGTTIKESFTALGSIFTEMFSGCNHLKTHPAIYVTTGSGTDFSSMYANCPNLISIGGLDLRNALTLYMMFAHCTKLTTLPLTDDPASGTFILGTSSATDFSYMFGWCTNLQYAPAMNTTSGTNFSHMFYDCLRLKALPAISTPNGTNFSNFAAYCQAITTVPSSLNLSNGTDLSNMFFGCYLLGTTTSGMFPTFNMDKATNVSGFIQQCQFITTAIISWPLVTNCASAFAGCYALRYLSIYNLKHSVSVQQTSLHNADFASFFSTLPTITDGSLPTVYTYGTPSSGSAMHDAVAALALRGWQVSGTYTPGA